jgi:hypothetical protein
MSSGGLEAAYAESMLLAETVHAGHREVLICCVKEDFQGQVEAAGRMIEGIDGWSRSLRRLHELSIAAGRKTTCHRSAEAVSDLEALRGRLSAFVSACVAGGSPSYMDLNVKSDLTRMARHYAYIRSDLSRETRATTGPAGPSEQILEVAQRAGCLLLVLAFSAISALAHGPWIIGAAIALALGTRCLAAATRFIQ